MVTWKKLSIARWSRLAIACGSLVISTHSTASPATSPLGLPVIQTTGTEPDSEDLRRLGKKLFNEARLSASGKISCATCHAAGQAFSDGRVTARGNGGRTGTRNTPSLFNVAYAKALFWDGRAQTLEEQVRGPLFNPLEHALPDEHALVTKLGTLPEYSASFEKACTRPCGPSMDTVARAIASYERSLLSGNSAFDRYYYGHEATALSARGRNGLSLFTGRAGCVQCHTITASDALLTDQQFHPSALPMRAEVFENLPQLTTRVRELRASKDSSALNGLIASDARVASLGRFLVTANPADINSYQTPSLRNVALTAPYMHDGSVATLREAVELELYRRSTTLEKPIVLALEEQEDIVSFLQALTGEDRNAISRVDSPARERANNSAL